MRSALVAVGAVLLLFVAPLTMFAVLVVSSVVSVGEEDQAEAVGCTTAVAQNDDEGVSDLTGVPGEWVDDVEDAARISGLPASVHAAMTAKESGWDESAVNVDSGAAGMAQAMPETWAMYGEGDPMDGDDALAFQGRYMKVLMGLAAEEGGLSGEEQMRGAAAAYNWGPGNMAGNGWKLEGLPDETEDYLAVIFDEAQVSFSASCEAAGGAWDGDLGDGEWSTPLPGGTMTGAGAYGPRNIPGYPAWANNHAGIDLATSDGRGIVIAPMPMRVTGLYSIDGCVLGKATEGPAFGLEFCHLDAVYVKVGEELDRGSRIGEEGGVAGNLGGRTVEHLHFAMYDPSGPDPQYPGHQNPVIDPTPLLREKGAL